jgi:glycerol-3-phosphate dehydrogenase
MFRRLQSLNGICDVVVIGGGATGGGIALEAAKRGYSVVLVERGDFGSGTSSRSTKLIHGGVRYLQQGNISLVREALAERAVLRQMAPSLVKAVDIVLPAYAWWERPFYGIGLSLYDALAARGGFEKSRWLSREETTARLPGIRREGLRGGILYQDGQFDDSRLLLAVLRSAAKAGAVVLNHVQAEQVLREGDKAVGIRALDRLSGATFELRASWVVNAAGPWAGAFLDASSGSAAPRLAPSQGSHIVLPLSFLGTSTGLLVPRTPDGRVIFLLPWQGHLLCGTTDRPLESLPEDPHASEEEISFLLETAGRYLTRLPVRADVLASFAGIRPLVKWTGASTAKLSREHSVHIDARSGVVSVIGGKWTTFRRMAIDAINQMEKSRGLPHREGTTPALRLDEDEPTPHLGRLLHPDFPDTDDDVRWFIRHTMPCNADDVLSRRLRIGMLNESAARAMRPRVEQLLAETSP